MCDIENRLTPIIVGTTRLRKERRLSTCATMIYFWIAQVENLRSSTHIAGFRREMSWDLGRTNTAPRAAFILAASLFGVRARRSLVHVGAVVALVLIQSGF